MAVIDPMGLFTGDRLRACSDRAKLLWPFIFLASNGFGRLELNLKSIQTKCFANFVEKPTEEDLYSVITEYADNFLLFVYEFDGVQWAQWDFSEKLLPRHKTAADLSSPNPAPEERAAFRQGYLEWKKAQTQSDQRFRKCSEKFQVLQRDSEGSGKLAHGIGIGVGIGEGKNTCPDQEQSVSEANASSPRRSASGPEGSPGEIYDKYPRKEGRRKAFSEIEKALKRLTGGEGTSPPMNLTKAREFLLARVDHYARSPAGRNPDRTKVPHPSTWFGQSRYLDDEENWDVVNGGSSPTCKPLAAREETIPRWEREQRQQQAGA